VHDEGELLRVHVVDHPVEQLDLARVVRRVAEDAEGDAAGGRGGRRAAADEEQQ
jgi:hypothetical protein